MSTSAPSRIALAVSNEHIPPKLRPPELIPPGEYGMTGVGHDIEQAFDRSCLVVWFSVDDFAGEIVLPRYYTIGVRNERGRRLVSAKRNSNLVLDMRELFDQRFRLDRIPVS